jgi:hypothetical protein
VRASVDAQALVVRSGKTAWPFTIDHGGDSATITLDGVAYRVRPQSWREKVRLARFARLGEAFVEASFLECCVAGGVPARLAADHKEALLALALWINLPDDDTAGLPLDADQLARATIAVCRAMSIGPLAIADLSAPEVESLWRNLDRGSPDEIDHGQPAWETFDNKIVVLPDAASPAEAEQAVARSAMAVSPRGEADSSPTEVEHAGTTVEPRPAPPAHEQERVTVARAQTESASAPARPQARFRVSFTTAAKERRVAPLKPGASSPKRASLEPIANLPAAESLPVIAAQPSPGSGAYHENDLSSGASAVSVAEWVLPPAATAAPRMTTAVSRTVTPRAGAPDIAPSFEGRAAPITSLLDEFCDRLDEAAADLGILEEV